MEKLFESWKKKEKKVNDFWENMYCELVSHIKNNICWFNLTYSRKRFHEKNMKNSFFDFIWSERDRIGRDTIIRNQENGGIG